VHFIHLARLNVDQAQTLQSAIGMLPLIGEAPGITPVCLVHGIFGSGKSFLIAVMILTFVQLAKLSSEQSRSVCKTEYASTKSVSFSLRCRRGSC
jgi:hypothetical protein